MQFYRKYCHRKTSKEIDLLHHSIMNTAWWIALACPMLYFGEVEPFWHKLSRMCFSSNISTTFSPTRQHFQQRLNGYLSIQANNFVVFHKFFTTCSHVGKLFSVHNVVFRLRGWRINCSQRNLAHCMLNQKSQCLWSPLWWELHTELIYKLITRIVKVFSPVCMVK